MLVWERFIGSQESLRLGITVNSLRTGNGCVPSGSQLQGLCWERYWEYGLQHLLHMGFLLKD